MKAFGKWTSMLVLGCLAGGGAVAQDQTQTQRLIVQPQGDEDHVVVTVNQQGDGEAGQVRQYRVVQQEGPTGRRAMVITGAVPSQSKYWLGVVATPVEGALKEHLDVEGLLIEEVVEDSPAAAAGLQANDILVKAGDAAVADLAKLVEVIDAGEGKTLTLVVIRKGERLEVEATPTERSGEAAALAVENFDQVLEFRPGMRLPFAANSAGVWSQFSPENTLSITIRRENDKDARIVVRRNGEVKEFEAQDLKNLKDLPEEVTAHLEKMLQGLKAAPESGFQFQLQPQLAIPGPPVVPGAPPAVTAWRFGGGGPGSDMADKLEKIMEKLESLEKRLDDLSKDK